jgi:hypothetical protein
MSSSNPGPSVTDGSIQGGLGSPFVVGAATSSLVGFYGTTPIAQRSGAAQATSLVGTASSADVTTDLKAAVIEIMNTLAALGVWKGSA